MIGRIKKKYFEVPKPHGYIEWYEGKKDVLFGLSDIKDKYTPSVDDIVEFDITESRPKNIKPFVDYGVIIFINYAHKRAFVYSKNFGSAKQVVLLFIFIH